MRKSIVCGHPQEAMISIDDGECYCQWCAEVAFLESKLKEAEKVVRFYASEAHYVNGAPCVYKERTSLSSVVEGLFQCSSTPMPEFDFGDEAKSYWNKYLNPLKKTPRNDDKVYEAMMIAALEEKKLILQESDEQPTQQGGKHDA